MGEPVLPEVGDKVRWKDGEGRVLEVSTESTERCNGSMELVYTVVVQKDDGVIHWVDLKELEGHSGG